MYINRHHRLDDDAALRALVDANALGTWVRAGPHGIEADHIPFLLDRECGPHGTLVGQRAPTRCGAGSMRRRRRW